MDEYVVVKPFVDLQDANHKYFMGDTFPRKGLVVSNDRIEELSSKNNRRKTPLISKVATSSPVKEEIPKEPVSESKEKPRGAKTGENPPKATRGRKSQGKPQRDV